MSKNAEARARAAWLRSEFDLFWRSGRTAVVTGASIEQSAKKYPGVVVAEVFIAGFMAGRADTPKNGGT